MAELFKGRPLRYITMKYKNSHEMIDMVTSNGFNDYPAL